MTEAPSTAWKTCQWVALVSAALLLPGCDAIWTVSSDARDIGRVALPAVFASTLLLAGWSIRQLFARRASKAIAGIAVALAVMALALAATLTDGFSFSPGALGRGDAAMVCTGVAPLLAGGISVAALVQAAARGESSAARGLGYLAVGAMPAAAYGAFLGVLLHKALLPHTPPTAIAIGNAHNALAIEHDGRVVAWGVRERPHLVAGLSGVKSIAAGDDWRCAITGAGRVACWWDRNSIQTLEGIDDAVEVTLATENLCVRRTSGEVDCRTMPGLGPQDRNLRGALTPIPDLVASQIVSARELTCAVRTSGKVACWGRGEKSVLGADASQVPLDIPGIDDASQVALGDSFACAETSSGGVSCWGNFPIASFRRTDDPPRPALIAGLADVTSIAAGQDRMCVVTHGAVDCWGYMTNDGRSDDSTDRWPVANLRKGAVRVFAGYQLTCVAMEDGGLWCWGDADTDLLRGEHARNCSNDKLHLTVTPCVGTPRPLLVDD